MSFPQVLTGVAHIGIPTNDLDKTIVFYKKLGFVSALETVNKAAGGARCVSSAWRSDDRNL